MTEIQKVDKSSKEYKAAYAREWRRKNKDKHNATVIKHRQKYSKEDRAAYAREWRQKNKDKHNAIINKYRRKHPDMCVKITQKWREKYPDRYRRGLDRIKQKRKAAKNTVILAN